MTSTDKRFTSSLIGQRLIEAGYLSREQIKEALDCQRQTALLFGEVCLLKGWLTYPQLAECLKPVRCRLGQRLLSEGYITMEQLWLAILEQRHTGQKLGDILVKRGWLDQTTVSLVQASSLKSNPAKGNTKK